MTCHGRIRKGHTSLPGENLYEAVHNSPRSLLSQLSTTVMCPMVEAPSTRHGAGPHQPTMAQTVGEKYLCLKPLRCGGICYCIMTQPTLTAPPPLLGPIQTIPCGCHTDIFPGLKLGADGHLVIATANDLERAREVTIRETAATLHRVSAGGLLALF